MSIENNQINLEKDLIKYFEDNILDSIVTIKKRVDKDGNTIIFPSVELTEILKLNLTESQNNKIFNYLTENGITINDKDDQIDKNIENYNYFSTYKQMILPKKLTKEESIQKFVLLKQTNDPVIREQLILNFLDIVPKIAEKYSKEFKIDQYELESYGYEAIIIAVDKFDYTRGTDFIAYANKSVVRKIMSSIPEMDNLKKIVFELYNKMQHNKDRESIILEITTYLTQTGLFKSKNIKENITKTEILLSSSLEELIENNEDIISNKKYTEEIDNIALKTTLEELIKNLKPREQIIITKKYGLLNQQETTSKEIGEQLNISEQRTKQIEAKALVKLKYPSNEKKIASSLEPEISGTDALEEYHTTYKKR